MSSNSGISFVEYLSKSTANLQRVYSAFQQYNDGAADKVEIAYSYYFLKGEQVVRLSQSKECAIIEQVQNGALEGLAPTELNRLALDGLFNDTTIFTAEHIGAFAYHCGRELFSQYGIKRSDAFKQLLEIDLIGEDIEKERLSELVRLIQGNETPSPFGLVAAGYTLSEMRSVVAKNSLIVLA